MTITIYISRKTEKGIYIYRTDLIKELSLFFKTPYKHSFHIEDYIKSPMHTGTYVPINISVEEFQLLIDYRS